MANPNRRSMVGRRYGLLKVLAELDKFNGPHRMVLAACRCDGKLVEVQGNNVRAGHTKSCGCLQVRGRRLGLKVRS